MPHIHTEPGQYDATASGYIVRLDLNEPRLLLHRHKKLGKYMQFGGHIELDESPWQALTHELKEESGYEMPQLSLLQPRQRLASLTGVTLHPVAIYHLSSPFTQTHWHTDLGYAFVAHGEPKTAIGSTESSDIIQLTRDELAALPAEDTLESVREAGLFIFDVCLKDWEVADLDSFA